MKVFIICVLAIISMVAASPIKDSEGYDVEEIISNRRLLLPYIKCSLDQGKCTKSAKELKGHIKETFETDCEKCTEEQKKDTRLVFKHIINKEKDYWNQIVAKYDPERKYSPKYEQQYLGKV